MNRLNWGILSTGRIARRFAKSLQVSQTGALAGVASRGLEKAEVFVKEAGAGRAFGSYEDLLADPEIEAVYIAMPHPMHAEWIIRAARAGKHILCEKPAALSLIEMEAAMEAVKENGVFFMEGFMYRCHPQTSKLVEVLRKGDIGEVRLIQCAFSFDAGYNADGRLFANHLGGGGILDVGCYCMSLVRLIAGVALGGEIAEPLEVKGVGSLDPKEKTDMWAAASLLFPGGILAQVNTGVQLNHDNQVKIFGSKGSITLNKPWFAGSQGAKIVVQVQGEESSREISTESEEDLYSHEIDLVARYKDRGEAPFPAPTRADTLGNMKVLDAWRKEIGLVYEVEKRENMLRPIWTGRLARRSSAPMKYGKIEGVDKPVSRLVMGVLGAHPGQKLLLLDDYFERGGNAFDTAHAYGSGVIDQALGHWVKTRGVRKDVVLVLKGGHTPNCYPEAISSELMESLERVHSDSTEIYIMHRDNEEIPVGEFIDVLNEHHRAGRIQVFGCSNWTLARLQEANEYARQKGLKGFGLWNNQLSLARMVDPVWNGCLSAADVESRTWLAKNNFPLMAWSSQARGFFTPRAGLDQTGDKEMVRCWYAEDNFERKRRAAELAKRKGCEEINIALAYVLEQPFPAFTLIGPATVGEMKSSMRSLEVRLSPEELKWLNLEV
jgi:predicted dehydrogenase/aryl-alcohol dehydrogenase-like predicted oxidoreductase